DFGVILAPDIPKCVRRPSDSGNDHPGDRRPRESQVAAALVDGAHGASARGGRAADEEVSKHPPPVSPQAPLGPAVPAWLFFIDSYAHLLVCSVSRRSDMTKQQKVPITMRALIQRINRKLAAEDQKLHATRGDG